MSDISVTIKKEVFNDVYVPHLEDERYNQIFFGGASSGKSVFIAQRIVCDLLKGKRNYLCVRRYKTDLRDSSFSEIVKFIQTKGLSHLFEIRESRMNIRCVSGSECMFGGMDDREKIKSITPRKGVITDIWIEEATEVTEDDYRQLKKRLRGGKISKRITMSFNPIIAGHWIEREFFGEWDDSKNKLEKEDLLILRTTYKDNKFLTDQDRELLESETDDYYYNVYTLGKWGALGNVIFKNWIVEDLSELKSRWDVFYGGVDFGWHDPAAVVSVGYKGDTIYVFEEAGGSELNNRELAEVLKGMSASNFTCDSAEPKSISELQSQGVRCQGADKGKDSVIYGIKWLQKHNIVVDVSCKNLIRELRGYKWHEKRDGTVIEQPVDRDNHWIDALRYAVEMLHGYEQSKKINVAVL